MDTAEIAHRLRVMAEQGKALVESLDSCTVDERCELRGLILAIAAAADALYPICAQAVEADIVHFPTRFAKVQSDFPAPTAIKWENWR